MELVVILIWNVLLLIGLPYLIYNSNTQSQKGLLEFAAGLEDSEVIERSMFNPMKITGRMNGRRIQLSCRGMLYYEVEVRHGMGSMVLTRDDLRQRLARIPPGSAQAHEARSALQHLIGRLGIERLVLSENALEFERSSSSYATRASSLGQVFQQLIRLAPLFESRSVQIQVLGDKAARGWTGGGEDILCPFCRDTVGQDELDLTACATCRTVHHAECFSEANGCTVFGCIGAPRARVSV